MFFYINQLLEISSINHFIDKLGLNVTRNKNIDFEASVGPSHKKFILIVRPELSIKATSIVLPIVLNLN